MFHWNVFLACGCEKTTTIFDIHTKKTLTGSWKREIEMSCHQLGMHLFKKHLYKKRPAKLSKARNGQ